VDFAFVDDNVIPEIVLAFVPEIAPEVLLGLVFTERNSHPSCSN
jgi:hypothetical protein